MRIKTGNRALPETLLLCLLHKKTEERKEEPAPSTTPPWVCTARQKDCPQKMLHCCNGRLSDGTQCGMWQHNALSCPHKKKNWKGSGKNSWKERWKPKGKGKSWT